MKVVKKIKPTNKVKKVIAVKKKPTSVLKNVKNKEQSPTIGKSKLASIKKKKKKQQLQETTENEEDPVLKKSTKKTKGNVKKAQKAKSKMPDIEGLKDIDPEFYDFLKKNDKQLLEFNVFDSDFSDDDEEEQVAKQTDKNKKHHDSENKNEENQDDEEEEDEGKFHKPAAEVLEVASDQSDFEDDDNEAQDNDNEDMGKSNSGTQKVTLNLLRQWQAQLEAPNVPIDVIRKVVQALNAALASLSTETQEQGLITHAPFKVSGAGVFDGVVTLCVLHLQPAVWRALGVQAHSKQPLHKYKKWTKLRSCLRYYLTDLTQLLQQISSANILSVLLKHLHQMAPVLACFSTLAKTILKRLITLWATDDETVRVIAFLCILKITRNQQCAMLHHVLKAMYLSYVRNSKFVSPSTLPSINFMRRSLVEIFALDIQASYHHAFLYIRQLAIHLRNALVLKKKDSYQTVYNWQYINSMRLWVDLLSATAYKPQLQPLVYPLITLIIGVVRLIPTAQYFPLRFHCVHMLIELSKNTNVFIPLLPLIVEVLRSNTFNKKHSKVSMRPMPFTFILRLNKTQLSENGFRDETVEQVFAQCLEYFSHESASLAFSDLVVPTVITFKKYLKECRYANYSRKLKQLLDKIKENSDFINNERRKLNCGLEDLAKIQTWETEVRQKGTPLDIYYASWLKTHEIKKRRLAAQADKINDDYDLPKLNKKSKDRVTVEIRNEHGQIELFPDNDSDNDMPADLVHKLAKQQNADDSNEEAEDEEPKAKKSKKSAKKTTRTVEEDNATAAAEDSDLNADGEEIDIVNDLDLDDW